MKTAIWQQVLPLLPPGAADRQPTKPARPDFGLDPLDFVELVLQVERECGIRFSAAELTELRMVQLLLSGVERPLRQSLSAQFFAQLLHNGSWL
ncbi:acyl carrier protein [Hymenobacter guriensis]|uniref:Acyl carrier protein n=1 Tax=Hymenobacter guriensis TaxID=2793065 RepID=A0ABS0L4K5_9BACT|nr:acyl carrier protein [Hymenobacter guriensis]MBG8555069.1 acyl carrier protein [Hymenobacter guriensis]